MTESPSPASTEAVEPQHDLGVLFVHGIGDQKQAETLVGCGEAIQEWLDQWLEGGTARFGMLVGDLWPFTAKVAFDGPWGPPPLPPAAEARPRNDSECQFERAALLPPLVGNTPAHAELTLTFAPGFGARPRRWLFAESWWGSQTIVPDISDFLGWLVTRGPWVVLLHLHQCFLGLDRPAWKQLPLGILVFAIWFAVSIVTVLTWIVVSLAALIPIGRWRAAVHDLLHRLAGVVGDSYDFVRAPMQRAAFVDATLAALAWLRPRCRRLVVLAHSQGVAVAHGALGHPSAPDVDRFVSYGAGLAKLRAMQIVEAATPGRTICAGLAAPVLAVALLWTIRLVQLQHDAASYYFSGPALLALAGFVCLYFAWDSVVATLRALRGSAPTLSLRERHPNLVWRDYYGTHDLVPNGSLSRAIGADELRSHPVTVLRSLGADHTSYWQSHAGFVAAIVQELDRVDGAGMFTPEAAAQLRAVARVDSRRARWYEWTRALEWAAVLAVLWFGRHRLIATGDEVRQWLATSPLASIGGLLDGIDSALAWFATTVLAVVAPDPKPITGWVLCGAILFVVWHIWRRNYRAIWAWWRDLVLERLFLPSYATASRLDNPTVSGMVVALGAVPIIVALLWLLLPATLGEVGIHRAFGLVAATIVTLFALLVFRMGLINAIGTIHGVLQEKATAADLALPLGLAALCLLVVVLTLMGLAIMWNITIVNALIGLVAAVVALTLAITIWQIAHNAAISSLRRWIALPLPLLGSVAAAWFAWKVFEPSGVWLTPLFGMLGALAAAFVAYLIMRAGVAEQPSSAPVPGPMRPIPPFPISPIPPPPPQ